jgi:hypothetical protein
VGKVLKVVAAVAAIAVAFVPGVGPALSGLIVGIGGGTFAALGVASTIVGVVSALGVTAALGYAAKAVGLGPKGNRANSASSDRLRATINPQAPRKVCFGVTAFATDLVYQSYTGSNKDFYNQVIVCASHAVTSIDSIYLDDKLAWTSAGGAQGEFVGYLTVTPRTVGTSANMVNIDSVWSAANNRRLTGCAYVWMQYKLTGNTKKTESPFANGVPSRMTIIGKGMPVYDPARDSTVGGSGTMRANDQTTWAFTAGGVDIGRNAALCELTWLLGWKINGKLAVGRGVPPSRIDMGTFITARNICAETVSLAAGGTEPRYRFDGIFAEDEDGGSVLGSFNASMAGVLRDNGGKLALSILYNDLSTPVATFSEADIVGPFDWQQTTPLEESRNVVRGRWTDPASLYQLVDYPQASFAAPDGIDRILTFDLPGVQSASQAQRLAKQVLQRSQYGGTFTAAFNAKGWGVLVGDPVRLNFAPLGWVNKPFRVVERTIQFNGVCEMVLIEENAALYAWAAEESAPVTPAAPTNYDYTKHPLYGLTRNADQGNWTSGISYSAGDETQDQGSTWGALVDHVSATINRPPTLPTTENAYWRLRARVGAQGPSGGLPAETITAGTTTYSSQILLNDSQVATVEARYRTDATTTAATGNSLQVQMRPTGGAWVTLTGGTNTQNNGTGDPVTLGVAGATFTNTSGQTQAYDLRAVVVNNGGGVERPELCYMRPA